MPRNQHNAHLGWGSRGEWGGGIPRPGGPTFTPEHSMASVHWRCPATLRLTWPAGSPGTACGGHTHCVLGSETRRKRFALEEEWQRLCWVLWVGTGSIAPFSGPHRLEVGRAAGQGLRAPSGGQSWSHTGRFACSQSSDPSIKRNKVRWNIFLNASSGLLWQLEKLLDPKYN